MNWARAASSRQRGVFLKLFGNNDYKTVTSQEEFQKYQSNFKYTFKAN
ncbi:hypothetical protein HMPREF9075_01676 [Capnocytophaga sp. oral taxon 332 str. F0381]|nr:hypothetical protein [Capnocytophaga sp. oral taxon 332]EKY08508.1 hypothetical protein HMPREF9075_01676 [Capnocytophaga sp. oral taxon 332 str. F0381]